MLQLSVILLSLVLFVTFGNAIKPPYQDPVEVQKSPGVNVDEDAGVAGPTTDSTDIPGRLKTPRTMRQSTSAPGVPGSTSAAVDTEASTLSNPGSGTLLGESPKSRGIQPVIGSDSDNKTPDSKTGQASGTLLDDSPKSKGRKQLPSGGGSGNTGNENPSTTTDDIRKLPSLKPSEGSTPAGTSSETSTKAPVSGAPTCDSMPAGSDKVPFSCFDQTKLKDYCTYTFGGAQTVQVSSGSKKSGIKRYVIDTTNKANWFQALGLCQIRNMSLATVESYDEQKALSSVLNNAGGVQNAWLSGNDLGQTNKYMWMTTGQPITWSNWFDGEPNHEHSGNETEHCLEVINYRWRWNDNLCDNQELFVCQYYSDN